MRSWGIYSATINSFAPKAKPGFTPAATAGWVRMWTMPKSPSREAIFGPRVFALVFILEEDDSCHARFVTYICFILLLSPK